MTFGVGTGCGIGMTLFVTHEGTNYRLVNELYNRGNEIATHTVTYIQLLSVDILSYHDWGFAINSFTGTKWITITGKILLLTFG